MRLWIKYIGIVLFLVGCTPEHELQNSSVLEKIYKDNQTKVAHKSIQGERESDTDEGIYVLNNGKISIKTDGRSLTSIMDELAFKMRFNYLITTPLPKERLAIYDRKHIKKAWKDQKGMTFKSVQDVFKFLEQFMNYASRKSDVSQYKIILNDDGIVISSNITDYKGSYKKMFLYNMTVDEAQKNIKEFFFKDAAGTYSILPLPAQNALIVKADKDILNQIGGIIHSIDADAPQVMIEAEVFEYDDTIGRKIGMAMDYSNINGNFSAGVKTVFGEGFADLVPSLASNYTDAEKKETLLTSLALEDRNGGVKILAEPRLVLKPGKEASLKLNTQKYVIVAGINDSSLKTIDTGITLTITPTILSQSTILLKLHLEQSEFIPSNEADIIQSTNNNVIDTEVVVNDGELVSLGGIYLSKEVESSSGLPVLKDIPYLGSLFGYDSKASSRTMIEFMIRPTIKQLHSQQRNIRTNIHKAFYGETGVPAK